MKTHSKSELSKMSLAAYGYTSNADRNQNGYTSRAEAKQAPRGSVVAPAYAALHTEALKALNRKSSLKPGQMYGYCKQLLDEMRHVMDTKGNKDHKLQPNELRFLSAGAKALVRFYESIEPQRDGKQPRPKPGP